MEMKPGQGVVENQGSFPFVRAVAFDLHRQDANGIIAENRAVELTQETCYVDRSDDVNQLGELPVPTTRQLII
jgi:hypothetical protein